MNLPIKHLIWIATNGENHCLGQGTFGLKFEKNVQKLYSGILKKYKNENQVNEGIYY
jgi:hypothetical protein